MRMILCLCLLLSQSVFAQQASVQHQKTGLLKVEYSLKEGKVTLFVAPPEKGTFISGIIAAEPRGQNAREKAKNANALKEYSITIGPQRNLVSNGQYRYRIPQNANAVTLVLKDKKGKSISETHIPTLATYPGFGKTIIPAYVVAGTPAAIQGSFDGELSNHQVLINNRPARVLAECPKQVFFDPPPHTQGKVSILSIENDNATAGETNVLHVALSADKLDLRRGENTTLRVQVRGLSGLDQPVPLDIINMTPGNVNLEHGNTQLITIKPGEHDVAGVYSKFLRVSANQTGGFTISADIIPPATEEGEGFLCNCYINGTSHLIAPDFCSELGGSCSPQPSGEDADIPPKEGQVTHPVLSFGLPASVNLQSFIVPIKIENLPADAVAIRITQKHVLEEDWTVISQAPLYGQFSKIWAPPLGYEGTYAIRTQVVNQDNTVFESTNYTQLSYNLNELANDVVFSISESDIQREVNRARALGDRIREERERLADLLRRLAEAEAERDENRSAAEQLEQIDETLEQIPRVFRDSLQDLVDSLDRLRSQLPLEINKSALENAVADAEARLKACQDRLAELKKEQADLEAERDRLKAEQDKLLEEMDRLHLENGWTGGHGYHPDGRYWYGYIGDERANTDIFSESYEIRRQIRKLSKRYIEALKRLKDLPAEMDAAEDECDQLNEALRQAREAAKRGDQYLATELEAEELCRQIRSLLVVLWRWCVDNPDACPFREKLRELFDNCPKSAEELTAFLNDYEEAIGQKRVQEEAFGDEADRQGEVAEDLEAEADRIRDGIQELEDAQQGAYAEAERRRQQRARELEEARRRQREEETRRAEEQARRDNPPPQPLLDEPIDPNDDQLKFQAQLLFKKLYLDYLVSRGPCDCTTMAIALANNTNTIVTDIIGRIGVGVAFAPLEAFPGVSLGGRLAIGAIKSIASALYGGQDFSEELAKNLFDVIGGEIFPKLVGNEFVGNRLNDLAGKGLEAILEAEGVRVINWEGKTRLRDCGEVSGKTTILVNPNTGWATILIKIDGCPLIVIKYRFNEDGVPQGNPIVRTVR